MQVFYLCVDMNIFMYIKYKDIMIVCVPNFHEEFILKAFITCVILFFPIHLVLREDYIHTIPIMQQRNVKS